MLKVTKAQDRKGQKVRFIKTTRLRPCGLNNKVKEFKEGDVIELLDGVKGQIITFKYEKKGETLEFRTYWTTIKEVTELGANVGLKSGSGYKTEIQFLDDMHTDTFCGVMYILKNGSDKKEFLKILYDNNKRLSTYSPDYIMSDVSNRLFILDMKGDKDRLTSDDALVKLGELIEYGKSESKRRDVEIIVGFVYYDKGVVMIKYGVGKKDFTPFHKLF